MSRKVVILLVAIAAGCGGAGGSAPLLTAEELREGAVGATLDALLGGLDLLAAGAPGGDAYVRGEPVRILVLPAPDGGIRIEAIGSRRTEASLRLSLDPDFGLRITGTIATESADGTVVEGTLDRVFARTVADLPGVGTGALFTAGNVDLAVRAEGDVVATGTAALVGRRALVVLSVDGTSTEAEIALAQIGG